MAARTVFIIAVILLSACSVRHGDYTVLSNKIVRLNEFELDKTDRIKNVVGEDEQHTILFIPIGALPSLDGALDDALRKADGDVMTDAVIESWEWYIPWLYGQKGWRITGDVVKTRRN